MKVSIALASYNGSRFIDEQLDSFARQTRLPDELVVCDDGSSDDTVARIERFAAGAPFEVRVERNPKNLGFSRNFEKALSLVTGDVVFISDQDDIWYPNKIERALGVLEEEPSIKLVVNDEDLMDIDGNPLNATFLGNVRKLGYSDSYHGAGCCTTFRSELLPLLLPVEAPANYDVWISNLTDYLGLRAVIDVPLQLYRRHGDNATATILAQQSVSLWALFRTYRLADTRREWRTRIETLRAHRRRIEEQRPLAERLAGKERVELALRDIEAESDRIERRLDLLARPRPARLPRVLKLWSRGFYRDFAGGKSAIKDILRA